MIRLTKRLLFAIEAVLDIAYNGGAAPVRSAEITERERIPRRYLEPVLQELVRDGRPDRHSRTERRLSPRARAPPDQPWRHRALGAQARNRRGPDERPGRQRTRAQGGPAALVRIAGRDDAAARRADPRRAVQPGRTAPASRGGSRRPAISKSDRHKAGEGEAMASDHDHSHQHAHGRNVRAVRHAAPGARARNDPDREGLCRSGRARPDCRGLRDPDRAA